MARLALLASALALVAGPAAACLVCIAMPERTLADRVLEADTVVLAREDPARPFAFVSVAMLKGASEGPPIPFLVDGATRRRLAADPDAAMLFAHGAEGWAPLVYASPEVRAMLDAILAAAPAWDLEQDHAARFAFFAERHDHPDAAIRALALAEIARAPYAQIRTIRPRLSRAEIARILRDPAWTECAPVHILFLGLSDEPADHAFVRRAFDAATAHGGPHLAAWATALAEIDGLPAIERLRALYFEDPARDVAALRDVVIAFATLAEGGDPALRPGIDAAFRGLVAGPPALAAETARQLARAQDFSHAATFADLLASGEIKDPAAEFAISVYLGAARAALGPQNQRSIE